MRYRSILLVGMLWLGLAGCTPWVQSVQPSQNDLVELDEQNPVGQTFVARYDGLAGVQVYLSPDLAGEGEVWLHLRSKPGGGDNFRAAVMPLSQITGANVYRFDFPPLADSNQQYYYAHLEVEGEGSLGVGASAGETYQDGALYQQETAQDGQLCFGLIYDPGKMALGLAQELLWWAGVLGTAGLFYIVPGWVIAGWLWRGWGRHTWAEKLSLAAGIGISFYILLILYTDLIGLHLGRWNAWGPLILGLAGITWQGLSKDGLKNKAQAICQWTKQPIKSLAGRLPDITLLILLGLVLLTRWWGIREIEVPMWGDSVQHTFITQLILDNGGLFQSWEPYAPYSSFGNQFGFPAAAAILAWVSSLDASQAVLWTGQVLNVLAILALYPLGVKLAKGNRWAGVGAVFAAGLVSTMPAFYFNWGRYAQLTGQVILPAALWMLIGVVESAPATQMEGGWKRLPWGKLCLAGAALSGMVIAQYRAPFFYLAFILAMMCGWWLPAWRLDIKSWWKAGLRVGLVVLIGIVLFLPWARYMLTSNIEEVAASKASVDSIWTNVQTDYQLWRSITEYVPLGLCVTALVGWLWSLLRQQWSMHILGWWAAWLASVYTWTLLRVPGAQQVPPFAALISLYMPVGLLFGWLLGQIIERLRRWVIVEACLALLLVGFGMYYAWEQRTVAVPQTYAMVTRPDMLSMSWIEANTSPEARFLVEGFRAYYNTTAVGSDAGWWIPLLAERNNSMPPLYALGSEVPLEEGYSSDVVELVGALETTPLNTSEGVALLCEQDISHVYIGQLQGLVGLSWLAQSFTPDELLNQPYYELVYHQDRVYIFALKEGVCNE